MAYLQDDKPEGGPYNWPSADEATVIGKEHERLDGLKKATGAAKYTYDINLKNQLVARALVDAELGGSIVNLTSIEADRAAPGYAAYAASKAAAISLTKTLGQSWARDGIRVNGLAPGLVPTKLTAVTTQNKDRAEASLRAIPVRRLGTPEEMAGAAMFLASPLASYVQGHTLIADGGLTL